MSELAYNRHSDEQARGGDVNAHFPLALAPYYVKALPVAKGFPLSGTWRLLPVLFA